ncbi:hypothetical protein C7B04_15915 [Escherichia sp. 4726-5]|nr:hypothetical protein C7B04_15915 [Escherichia sp. 4726-5]
MTSRPFLRKNHNFKRGLSGKWCIGNTSLDNAHSISKFIEIIMLINMNLIFLKESKDFPFYYRFSSFFGRKKYLLKRSTDRN